MKSTYLKVTVVYRYRYSFLHFWGLMKMVLGQHTRHCTRCSLMLYTTVLESMHPCRLMIKFGPIYNKNSIHKIVTLNQPIGTRYIKCVLVQKSLVYVHLYMYMYMCNACGSIEKANIYGSGYFDDPLPNGGPLLVRGHLIYKRHYTMPYHCMVYGMLYILQPG